MDVRALPPPDYKMQVIIIGDSGVGKTSFMDRFVEGNHRAAYNATVGIDFKVRRLDINDKAVKLQIWDTAGQEKFNAITTAYYRQARAAIIMYDVTRPNSFANLRKWFKLVRENGRPDISIALVGNKTDQEEMRQVSATQGERLRQEENCIFFESSAKGDSNVYNVFETLAKDVMTKMPPENHLPYPQNLNIGRNSRNEAKKSCC